jgi:hypothetical protein
MVSAVIAHRCNTIEELRALHRSPDVIGAEIDLFCGPVVTGLFCGHYSEADMPIMLAQHVISPYLIPFTEMLAHAESLELVLDFKGTNPLGLYANYKPFAKQLAKRQVPFYTYSKEDKGISQIVRTTEPDTRVIWKDSETQVIPPVTGTQNRSSPFDLNSLLVWPKAFLRDPKSYQHIAHLHFCDVTENSLETICASLAKVQGRERFGIQRVSFSANQPALVARALLRHRNVFEDHLSRATLAPAYAYA